MQDLPPLFIQRIQEQLGNEAEDFFASLLHPPPVSVRLNPFKRSAPPVPDSRVQWAENAWYLKERISFTADPAFHAGAYYVQEAASMLVEPVFQHLFKQNLPRLVLDLCAAPGGKSTHLLSLMQQKGMLVSNEIHPVRNSILRQNLARWGTGNKIITQLPAKSIAAAGIEFDLVLCDAPCSGEGLFRKDPAAIKEWSAQSASFCATRQEIILSEIDDAVKLNGYLIYSTCTYNPEENDVQIKKLTDTGNWESVQLDLSHSGAVPTKHGWQCYPHRVKGEGFYISALKKINFTGRRVKSTKTKKIETHKLPVSIPDGFSIFKNGERYFLIPSALESEMKTLTESLPFKSVGIEFGTMKSSDFIPSAEYALSIADKSFPAIDNNLTDSLRFLRGETPLYSGEKKGWHLMNYDGLSMGWVKVVDRRINNNYPREWRILKGIDRLIED
jgi:16S rRNA C967 or C1407 C5-methylase (RsmB/RsmF family)/NOL1/NOP2/fmu family ribosome biogenesis protein